MSNSVDIFEDRTSLTRREFTLGAALAILAGCVITISDTACSKSPAPAPTPLADVSGAVSANHGHAAVVTGAQITASNAVTLNIQGTAAHSHTVTMSQVDLTSLKNRQTVTSTSSTDASHSHTVTFTPV